MEHIVFADAVVLLPCDVLNLIPLFFMSSCCWYCPKVGCSFIIKSLGAGLFVVVPSLSVFLLFLLVRFSDRRLLAIL